MTLSKRVRLIAAGAALAAACAGAYAWLTVLPIHRLKEAVRAELRDPESARFEQLEFNRKTGGGCGLVNARNGMGGYVGFRPFVVNKGIVTFSPPEADKSASLETQIQQLQTLKSFLDFANTVCEPEPDPKQ